MKTRGAKISKILPAIIFISLFNLFTTEIFSQEVQKTQHAESLPDSVETGQFEPYKSRKPVYQHILAAPSYLFHAATRPLGMLVKEIEWNYQHILIEGLRTFVFPTLETGGSTSFAFGLTGFHKNLLNTGHNIDFSGSYGSRDFFSVNFRYTIPDFLHEKNELEYFLDHRSNPFESFFLSDIENRDEAKRRFADLEFETGVSLKWHHMDWFTTKYRLSYKRVNMRSIDEENTLTPQDVEGFGVSKYFISNADFIIDKRAGEVRLDRGYHLTFSGGYGRQIDGKEFDFFRYLTEANLLVPLQRGRRFVIKGLIERYESTEAGTVPFFELPNLGANNRLRGFPNRRFVNRGILVLSGEYRYPIWDEFDMVFFWDEGQAFDRFGEVGLGRFKTSAGFGLHVVESSGVLSKLEFAFSSEEARILFTLSPGL